MAESLEYLGEGQENLKGTIGKFVGISPAQAKEFRQKLEDLNMIKINDKHIAKIIDLLPANSEDLNKIFNDVGLGEDESNKIIDIVKQFE